MKSLKALIIGHGSELMFSMPAVLNKAGFIVDAISDDNCFSKSKFIDNYEQVSIVHFVDRIRRIDVNIYDLIVACDDLTLKTISESDLFDEIKLRFIPVTDVKFLSHIYSKIELSKILEKSCIKTPPFFVANNKREAVESASRLGYPVMLKENSGGGGNGVFQCQKESDIALLPNRIFDKPLLLQKKIIGEEFDFSAVYFDQKLIHFNCARPEKTINRFGPSSLRTYYQTAIIEKDIFNDMANLGKALGANGFVNISAMKSSEDGRLYFFEADMRPNVWIDLSRFVGDDASVKIANWFAKGEFMTELPKINNDYPRQLLIPYFFRLNRFEILFNCYDVWKFLPKEDKVFLKALLIEKILFRDLSIKNILKKIKRIPLKIIRSFVPLKHDRAIIRARIGEIFNFRRARF